MCEVCGKYIQCVGGVWEVCEVCGRCGCSVWEVSAMIHGNLEQVEWNYEISDVLSAYK